MARGSGYAVPSTHHSVATAEGGMYGPGEEITGKFDPRDEHNARLIADGEVVELAPAKSTDSRSSAKQEDKAEAEE